MLRVDNLVKSYEGDRQAKRSPNGAARASARVLAVNDVSFEVDEGEMFTLLGPSGCGKTTTLRSIAGLEEPDSGRIAVADQVLFSRGVTTGAVNLPANRRGLGMVFQSYAIWPHMSVFDNVAFPLQVKPRKHRGSKHAIKERVARVLETMELDSFADRSATKLSGGQQQRLALARAIVLEPPLLLLDEPLSNLDAKLRESLRYELKRLQRELGITSVYVTHDQTEALALSSRIAVMCDGNVLQVGKPREIYEKPANRFVAEFIGTSNFLDGIIASRQGRTYRIDTPDGQLMVDSEADVASGKPVVISVRPECVALSPNERPDAGNEWNGVVLTRAFLGDAVDHIVAVGKKEIRVRSDPTRSYEPGTQIYLHLPQDRMTLVPIDWSDK